MDLDRYIKELRDEHGRIDEMIKALESIGTGSAIGGVPLKRGRGRPRKDAVPLNATKRGKS